MVAILNRPIWRPHWNRLWLPADLSPAGQNVSMYQNWSFCTNLHIHSPNSLDYKSYVSWPIMTSNDLHGHFRSSLSLSRVSTNVTPTAFGALLFWASVTVTVMNLVWPFQAVACLGFCKGGKGRAKKARGLRAVCADGSGCVRGCSSPQNFQFSEWICHVRVHSEALFLKLKCLQERPQNIFFAFIGTTCYNLMTQGRHVGRIAPAIRHLMTDIRVSYSVRSLDASNRHFVHKILKRCVLNFLVWTRVWVPRCLHRVPGASLSKTHASGRLSPVTWYRPISSVVTPRL